MAQRSGTLRIRPRQDSDLAECVQVLQRVKDFESYPRSMMPLDQFISDPIMPFAWVAELDEDSNDEDRNSSSSSTPPKANKSSRIIGHIAIGKPLPTDLAVQTWNDHQAAKPNSHSPSLSLAQTQAPDNEAQNEDSPGNVAILKRLYVDPEARGYGAASKLIEAATADATGKGLRLILFVNEVNAGARRIYDRLGWEVFGENTFRWKDEEGIEQSMPMTLMANPV